MIRDPELRSAVERAYAAWEKRESEKAGGQLTLQSLPASGHTRRPVVEKQ